jgi:hypothetical protein
MISHLWSKAQLIYTNIMEQTGCQRERGVERRGVSALWLAVCGCRSSGHYDQGP